MLPMDAVQAAKAAAMNDPMLTNPVNPGYRFSPQVPQSVAHTLPQQGIQAGGRTLMPPTAVNPIMQKGGINPPSDTIRNPVLTNYQPGDLMSEDDFEGMFKKKEGDASTFPQTSVQDYSKVKEDEKGKYINKLND